VPDRKVTKIEWDTEFDFVVIEWSDGRQEEAILLELIYGPQGTWARLTPADDPTYVICVTQSATMPSETYILHEVPLIPEQPVVITEPEMTEGSQELPSTQEQTLAW
jgi:hypothetical protein